MPQAPSSTLPRILLVEDHDMTRRMQIRFLSRTYAVDFASTGEEAIDLAIERSYEAVLVDIGLDGGLTGVDVMQTLKQTPGHRGTAMVAVTGYATDEDRERLIAAGFDLYLAKPFRWQEFTDVIQLAVRLTAEGAVQAPPARPRSYSVFPAEPRPAAARPATPTTIRLGDAAVPLRTVRPAATTGDGLAQEAVIRPAVRLRPAPPADLSQPEAASAPPREYPFLTWQPLSGL